MEERKIKLSNGKEITIREITFKETFTQNIRDKIDKEGYAPAMIQLSCGLTDEELNSLSKKDGLKLLKVYNELNEDESFQSPQEEKNN